MRHIETTIDIVLRRTNRKWLGIVQIDGREVYRTLDYHDTKECALDRADAWFKETMQEGNIEAMFKQILGTSNPAGQPRTASVRSVAPGCSNSEVPNE